MQYAEVIVNRRTSFNRPTFTYRIPPELLVRLEPGALLEVPFGEKKTLAVLRRLVRRTRQEELRSILRVINASALLPPQLFRLAERLSANYLEPIAKILFFMLPPLPKRQPALPPFAIRKLENQTRLAGRQATKKPALLIAPRTERFQRYRIEIAQALAIGQSAILLVPDTTARYMPPFIEELQRLHLQPTIMSGELSPRARFSRWLRVRTGPDPQIVIGSFHAAFAPVTNLGLIIVEEEPNPLYKSERSPRLHLREVAITRAALEQSAVVLGASLPSPESYQLLHERQIRLEGAPTVGWPERLVLRELPIGQPFHPETLGDINRSNEDGKTVAIFINRFRQRPCDECGSPVRPEAERCPTCGRPLSRFTLPRLRRELLRALPNVSIETVAKGEAFDPSALLFIGTRRLNELGRFDLGVVCLSTLGQSIPDFRATEYTFRELIEFLERCNEVIIQTFDREGIIERGLGKRSLKSFLSELLVERTNSYLPPAFTLISLVYTNRESQMSTVKYQISEAIGELQGRILSLNKKTGQMLIALPRSVSPARLRPMVEATRPQRVDVDPYRF